MFTQLDTIPASNQCLQDFINSVVSTSSFTYQVALSCLRRETSEGCQITGKLIVTLSRTDQIYAQSTGKITPRRPQRGGGGRGERGGGGVPCKHSRVSQSNIKVMTQSIPQGLFVGCLTSQQDASLSQGRISSDKFTCCHIEIEVADPTFYLTQSQYTDIRPTSPSADPIMPGVGQGSHWSGSF